VAVEPATFTDWHPASTGDRRGNIKMGVSTKQMIVEPEGTLQLKGYDAAPGWIVGPLAEKEPATPSEWFGKLFPRIQQRFGPAFLESVSIRTDGQRRLNPVSMNEDFMAGTLGGDEKLKHKIVFFTVESTFYFFDPRTDLFAPTTEEKLKLLASQMLVRCAQAMPRSVHIDPLFNRFRDEDSLRSIVKKAKALLAADSTFFAPESSNKRADGPETHERLARMFIRKSIKPEPMKTLTVRQFFEMFCSFCKASGIAPVERKNFTRWSKTWSEKNSH
jgi:hypothetical protein